MLVVFVLDTSASMNQRLRSPCLSLLDLAKMGVDHFVKARQSRQETRTDKYVMVSTDSGGGHVKVTPKDSPIDLSASLRYLTGHGYTCLGDALRSALEVLNQDRLSSGSSPGGLDNYGLGWNPAFCEPAAILLFTDGTLPTSEKGIVNHLNVPPLQRVEQQLNEGSFHWDQRLFSVEIRAPVPTTEQGVAMVEAEQLKPREGLRELSESVGGSAHVVRSLKELLTLMEQLAACIRNCIVAQMRVEIPSSLGPDLTEDRLSLALVDTHPVALYSVSQAQGRWPIQEDFGLEPSTERLPLRRSHPHLVLRRSRDFDGQLPWYLPCDQHELGSCAFTDALLSQHRNEVWKVYVRSRDGGPGDEAPCGFVKANPEGTALHLFMLPYNF
eukprot:RCo039717